MHPAWVQVMHPACAQFAVPVLHSRRNSFWLSVAQRQTLASKSSVRYSTPSATASDAPPVPLPPPASIAVATVGILSLDITVTLPRLPSHTGDNLLLPSVPTLSLGGSFNALICASRLGATTAPVGFVAPPGSSTLAAQLSSAARDFGFTTCGALSESQNATVPTCVVLVETAGHTFLATNEGKVSGSASPRKLPVEMKRVLAKSRFLIVDAYAVAGEAGVVNAVLSECAARIARGDLHVYVDPQAVGIQLAKDGDAAFCAVLKSAVGISVTEEELFRMRDSNSSRQSLPLSNHVTRFVNTLAPRALVVLVKRGERGCLIAYRATTEGTWCFLDQGGFDVVSVVDSTGCGDGFLGAFLASLDRGLSLAEAAELACAAGAATVGNVGAGEAGIASLDELNSLLKNAEKTSGV